MSFRPNKSADVLHCFVSRPTVGIFTQFLKCKFALDNFSMTDLIFPRTHNGVVTCVETRSSYAGAWNTAKYWLLTIKCRSSIHC